MTNKIIYAIVISDSVGETASQLVQASIAQFPNVQVEISRYPFTKTIKSLQSILEIAKEKNALVVHTLAEDELTAFTNHFCRENNLYCMDLLNPLVRELEIRSGETALKESGRLHRLNNSYFERMSAMEFAVRCDDGKDPKGFLEADIVLLGISRTSKTPLSLFLANKNLKVANLPLVPECSIPEELWQVDKRKIVGLTNDPQILNEIRRERMIAYGLNPDTNYSDMERIEEELIYAQELYNKIDCLEINVARKSIEETAAIILEKMDLHDFIYQN